MRVQLTEVIHRSEEGTTRPFFCRCDDGFTYYVKGNYAGKRTRICEWIAGRIGQIFELNQPEIRIIEIPAIFFQHCARDDFDDIGNIPAFGSRYIDNSRVFHYNDINKVDPVIRAKILLFDWWVSNGDRILSEHGGNPNLIISAQNDTLWVFDHNLAFQETNLNTFWNSHIFVRDLILWSDAFKVEMNAKMDTALGNLNNYWMEMPEEWTEMVEDISYEKIYRFLTRKNDLGSNFWRNQ